LLEVVHIPRVFCVEEGNEKGKLNR
jgi:hypothetical protein